jgi:hypothetical protein
MRVNDRKIMNTFIMLAMVAVCLLLAKSAIAGQAVVTWTNPTTRTDGSAFPLSAIGSTQVEYGTCSGTAFGTVAGNQSATGGATTLTITNLAAGTWCFRARSVDTSGLQSGWSAIASKVVPVAPPNPPTIVTVATTAYVLKQWADGRKVFSLVQSGSVPLGIECDLLPGLPGFGIADGKVAVCGSDG